MEEIDIEPIRWSAPEYIHKPREIDFLWTIGLVTLFAAIIAVWLHNFLFAVFILISGFCLIFFTIRPPQDVEFVIDNNGMTFGRDKYSWKNIKGYHIKKNHPYDKLMIATTKKFLPLCTVPLPHDLATDVKTTLLNILPDIEIEESQSTLFMEKLGF